MDSPKSPINDGFPLGINNLAPNHALPPGALRDGENIDLYDDGKPKRRRGSTRKITLTGSHSGWCDPLNPNPSISYYVAGTTLYSLKENAGVLTSTPIVTGLAAGTKVSYLQLNGDVFWSNGIVSGRIHNGSNAGWGVESPSRKPTLATTSNGGLDAGTYQVVLTYRNSSGEEGGADDSASIVVSTNGAIVMSGLPTPIDANVTHICAYCTYANGDAFYKVAVLPVGTSSHTITSVSNATTALKTQFLQPMPPCNRIAHLHGVIYVAVGSYIFHSEPLRYGLCNLNENYYTFPQDVDEILAVPDGLYVCSDQTYFLRSPGTGDVQQQVVLPYGAVAGTGVYFPNNKDVGWFSPRGQIIGSMSGQVRALTEGQYMPGVMSSGTSIIRERQGLRQIINTVQQSEISRLEITGE